MHESTHLSDLDIARLVAGEGSRPLRQSLSEHLADCAACRHLVAEAFHAQRAGAEGTPPSPPIGPPPDPDLRERVFRGMEEAATASAVPRPRTQVVPLQLRMEAPEGALAAEPATGRPVRTYFSHDGTIVICVECPEEGQALVARIARRDGARKGSMWLIFKNAGLAFQVGAADEVELPGVAEGHLTPAGIEIEFRT